MSRLKGTWPPEGYECGLHLWLRQKHEGGSLLDPGEFRPGNVSRRECLVLVHGYNNHAIETALAYRGFRRRQLQRYSEPITRTLHERLADTYWPGDANWWGPFDKADFLVYPAAVGTARRAGPILARLLLALPDLARVSFLGHSLGCRVVLETVQRLAQHGRPTIDRVCLMAAAVPAEMLEPGGRFHPLLTTLSTAGTEVKVLHSTGDRVLHLAFPAGQTAAGEPSTRALGRVGPTASMPGHTATLTGRQMAAAGHGDYWGHSEAAIARIAAEYAGEFLHLGLGRSIDTREPDGPRPLGTPRRIA
jgi:hypothetical protein